MAGHIELDRRSYFGLSKARLTVDGAEPRRAFNRLGSAHRNLRTLLRQTPEGRKLIRAETRTLIRRDAEGKETVYRVSLDARLAWLRERA